MNQEVVAAGIEGLNAADLSMWALFLRSVPELARLVALAAVEDLVAVLLP